MTDYVIHNDGEADPKFFKGSDLIKELKKKLLKVKAIFMTEKGKVDYKDLRGSEVFEEYKALSRQLRFLDLKSDLLDEAERRSFFINLYNCLTIHTLAGLPKLPENPLKVEGMWKVNAYNIGGLLFSLDDIEHGVLRQNAGHPNDGVRRFQEEDPRVKLVVPLDPRIHFALNCGANSCPLIGVYSSETLDKQLALAAKNFNSSSVEVDDGLKVVKVSKLFLWYRVDFGKSDQEVISTVRSFVGSENDNLSSRLLGASERGYKLDYFPYDWALNKVSK